jgi:hypothetical protein
LCAGDFADPGQNYLNLPGHAIALYDAALEYMDKHPESIAEDTDCAAASLNLIDLLMNSGQEQAAMAATRRAGRMPVKTAEQNVWLAFWLREAGDAKTAYHLFQRGKAVGLEPTAAAMGLTVDVLKQIEKQIEQELSRAAGEQKIPQPKGVPCSLGSLGDSPHPVNLFEVPYGIKKMLYAGHLRAICRECIDRLSIPVEDKWGVQEKIWYEGEKYLGYGDVFVNI